MVTNADTTMAMVSNVDGRMHSALIPVSADMTGMAGMADAADTADTAVDAAATTGDQHPDSKQLKVQADLEDQTLPAPFATLPLDWHPFPHLYPHVNDGTSAFIDLQRPPPSV